MLRFLSVSGFFLPHVPRTGTRLYTGHRGIGDKMLFYRVLQLAAMYTWEYDMSAAEAIFGIKRVRFDFLR